MKLLPRIAAVMFLLVAVASAQTLSGTVKNGTTDKPAAGDDVVLIKLGQGMEEAARTKTSAQGKFSFKVDDPAGPHLIRVIHQDVTYHQMAPPGTTNVDAEVYDVSKKVEGVSAVADLMYVQAGQGQLGISRLFAVDNSSKPPRTQMSDRNFEFYLPENAQIDQGQAQTAGGQWVESAPVPQAEKGRYAFVFPLRPGTTQFQVSYHLAYDGNATIDPKPLYPLQHLVVIVPKTIQFSATQTGLYESKQPPDQPKANAQVAANIRPGQTLSFAISGTGILQDQAASGGDADSGGAPPPADAQAADSRPGGGLGPPIEAPDPLDKYRWWLFAGFILLLAAGAFYIAKRPMPAPTAAVLTGETETAASPRPAQPAAQPAANGRSGMLLEALKEELFALEVEHKQGSISQQDYEKARSALDQTLERAVKRSAAK